MVGELFILLPGGAGVPIVDLYSSRQNPVVNDVWVYDQIPEILRVQVCNIVEGALGAEREQTEYSYGAQPIYKFVSTTVAHEHGRATLSGNRGSYADDVRS